MEVRLTIPAGAQEEASLWLTELSGRGVILEDEGAPPGGVMVRAFFRAEEFGPGPQEELQTYLQRLRGHGLYPLGLEFSQVAEEDWAEAWKAHFKAMKVTPRLVVVPPWEEYRAAPDELVITIYPAMAFGTGRHPTTLLCLRALEEVLSGGILPAAPGPWGVLDVGTGTGILALAAARLGARVLAIDVDPEAVAAALENVALNALKEQILVELASVEHIREQFALILANLTAPDLRHLAEPLAGRLVSGGSLIISGFLIEDLPDLMEQFIRQGLSPGPFWSQEDWGVLILKRP